MQQAHPTQPTAANPKRHGSLFCTTFSTSFLNICTTVIRDFIISVQFTLTETPVNKCRSDQIDMMWVKGQGYKRKSTVHALCTHHKASFISLQNVHSDWSYEYTSNMVNVYKRRTMLPGCSDVSLKVTTPYLWRLCTLLGNSASKVSGQ